jgi:hypothetical protein
MKKILIPAFAVLTLLVVTGCPVGLDYSLGKPGSEKIDKRLVGTWVPESNDAEVRKVKISKKDDTSYKVEVIERGEMYALETDNFTGWVTELNGATFFFVQPDNEEKFYHYQYKMGDNGQMTTNDVSLLDGGVDAVTSTESLREQVESSMKQATWAEEKINWEKE